MLPGLVSGWGEVIPGLRQHGAPTASWGIHTVVGVVMKGQSQDSVSQGGVLFVHRGIGHQKRGQLLLVGVMPLLQPPL